MVFQLDLWCGGFDVCAASVVCCLFIFQERKQICGARWRLNNYLQDIFYNLWNPEINCFSFIWVHQYFLSSSKSLQSTYWYVCRYMRRIFKRHTETVKREWTWLRNTRLSREFRCVARYVDLELCSDVKENLFAYVRLGLCYVYNSRVTPSIHNSMYKYKVTLRNSLLRNNVHPLLYCLLISFKYSSHNVRSNTLLLYTCKKLPYKTGDGSIFSPYSKM
jgi:hypothetical protein